MQGLITRSVMATMEQPTARIWRLHPPWNEIGASRCNMVDFRLAKR